MVRVARTAHGKSVLAVLKYQAAISRAINYVVRPCSAHLSRDVAEELRPNNAQWQAL